MLLTEWNTEDAIAVAREEGLEEGLEKGLEKGRDEGLEIGRIDEKIEIAKNLLAAGSSNDLIQKVTKLTLEEIMKLENQK